MTAQANTTVSDERLARMLSALSQPIGAAVLQGDDLTDIRSALTELSARRATADVTEAAGNQPQTQAGWASQGKNTVEGNQPQDIVISLMNNPPDSWAGSVGDPGRAPYDQGWDAACKALLAALTPPMGR